MKKSESKVVTVDEYINRLSPGMRNCLEKLRKYIKAAAPKAQEVISYQIPVFKFNGPIAAIAAFENHCSFYTMSHAISKAFSNELKPYDHSGVTVRFPPGKPLRAALVKKLVLAKIKENDEKIMAREARIAAKKKDKVATKKAASIKRTKK